MENKTLENQLAPLNDPENRKTIEQYARAFVEVIEPVWSFSEGKAPEGTYEAALANAIHYCLDMNLEADHAEKHSEVEKRYLHDIVDTFIAMPHGGIEHCKKEEKTKAAELIERQKELTENYLKQEFDTVNFLKTAFEVQARYCLNPDIKDNHRFANIRMRAHGNAQDSVAYLVDQLGLDHPFRLSLDPGFVKYLKEKIKIPQVSNYWCSGDGISSKLPRLILDVLDGLEREKNKRETSEDIERYFQRRAEHVKKIDEGFDKCHRLSVDFSHNQFFQKVMGENPALRDEIIAEGRPYGVEWRLKSEPNEADHKKKASIDNVLDWLKPVSSKIEETSTALSNQKSPDMIKNLFAAVAEQYADIAKEKFVYDLSNPDAVHTKLHLLGLQTLRKHVCTRIKDEALREYASLLMQSEEHKEQLYGLGNIRHRHDENIKFLRDAYFKSQPSEEEAKEKLEEVHRMLRTIRDENLYLAPESLGMSRVSDESEAAVHMIEHMFRTMMDCFVCYTKNYLPPGCGRYSTSLTLFPIISPWDWFVNGKQNEDKQGEQKE